MSCTCKESNDVHSVTTNAYSNCAIIVSFEVLTAVVLRFQVFWRVTPYGLVIAYRRFESQYFLQFHPVQSPWSI